MLKILRPILIVLFMFGLGGCSTPGDVLTTPFSPAIAPPPGYALVYFYRLHHDIGRNVWPDIYVADQKIVGLANLGYSWIYVKPGRYVVRQEKAQAYTVDWGKPSTLEFDQADTYFVRLDTGATKIMTLAMGKYASPDFKDSYSVLYAVEPEVALSELKQCRFIKPLIQKIN